MEDSHYVKFCGVRDEFAALCAADPGFAPAWPVARNPVMRKPPTPEGKVHVDAPDTARLLDLGNATYGLMLRCLMGAFGQPAAGQALRRALYDTAIDLMHAIVPLAEQLARLPATTGAPTPTAGLTFTLPRSITPISDPRLLRIIAERADEIAKASSAIAAGRANLASVPAGLVRIASSPATATGASVHPPAAGAAGTVIPVPEPAAAQPASRPPVPVEEVAGRDITIRFDGKRCIHARFCVLQAPTVFKANTAGTWIYPDAMDAERLVEGRGARAARLAAIKADIAARLGSGDLYGRRDSHAPARDAALRPKAVRNRRHHLLAVHARAAAPLGDRMLTEPRLGAWKTILVQRLAAVRA